MNQETIGRCFECGEKIPANDLYYDMCGMCEECRVKTQKKDIAEMEQINISVEVAALSLCWLRQIAQQLDKILETINTINQSLKNNQEV